MPLYFAYGSNLLTARLTARCHDAKPLMTARLANHRAAIAKHSTVDGSGKATLLSENGQYTCGFVYSLPSDDLLTLDAIEGVGQGYERIACALDTPQGSLECVTYIASAPNDGLVPFDWYLALIIAGARQHGLPPETLTSLLANGYTTDTTRDRPARKAAMTALSQSGHKHWQSLLPPLTRA